MSRLAAYINKDTMEREDVAALMSDDNQDLQILRMIELDENDGFRETNVSRSYKVIKTVVGRIDRRDRVYTPQDSTDGKVVKTNYVATVYYKDLRKDDRIFDGQATYTVTYINKATSSFTEAEIEILV